MESLKEFFRKKPSIGLVGASNNTAKYGSIIFRDLTMRGYEVIPINPRESLIHGKPAFPNLEQASQSHKIELLVYVIPPSHTLKSLEEALSLGLKRIWIQPGAGDSNVKDYLEKNDFDYIMNACVLVEGK